jgi:hypothetical protein
VAAYKVLLDPGAIQVRGGRHHHQRQLAGPWSMYGPWCDA